MRRLPSVLLGLTALSVACHTSNARAGFISAQIEAQVIIDGTSAGTVIAVDADPVFQPPNLAPLHSQASAATSAQGFGTSMSSEVDLSWIDPGNFTLGIDNGWVMGHSASIQFGNQRMFEYLFTPDAGSLIANYAITAMGDGIGMLPFLLRLENLTAITTQQFSFPQTGSGTLAAIPLVAGDTYRLSVFDNSNVGGAPTLQMRHEATLAFSAPISPAAVPEPSSLLLLGTAASVAGVGAWRRRKRSSAA